MSHVQHFQQWNFFGIKEMIWDRTHEVIVGKIHLDQIAVTGHEIIVYRALQRVVFDVDSSQIGHIVESGGDITRKVVVVQPNHLKLCEIRKGARNQACQSIISQLGKTKKQSRHKLVT